MAECALHSVRHEAGSLPAAVFSHIGLERYWRSRASLDIGSVFVTAYFTAELRRTTVSRKTLQLIWR